ncbi:MAG: hypothetical protein H6845_02650 [Alphaproteobacteria bacterium]|nr:MAG: hypothetical protein H6845_02650 [Alphaproteobacteria bacterium]
MQSQVSDLETNLQTATDKLTKENSDSAKQVSKLQNQVKDLQATLSAKEDQARLDLAEKDDLKQAKLDSEEHVSKLKNQVSDLEINLQTATDALNKAKSDSEEQVSELQSQVSRLEISLQTATDELNKSKSDSEEQVSKLKNQVSGLEISLQAATDELNKAKSDSEEHVSKLQSQVNELQTALNTIEQDPKQAKIDLYKLEQERQDLAIALDNANLSITCLNEELDRERLTHSIQNSQLCKKIEDLRKDVKNKTEQLSAAEVKITKLGLTPGILHHQTPDHLMHNLMTPINSQHSENATHLTPLCGQYRVHDNLTPETVTPPHFKFTSLNTQGMDANVKIKDMKAIMDITEKLMAGKQISTCEVRAKFEPYILDGDAFNHLMIVRGCDENKSGSPRRGYINAIIKSLKPEFNSVFATAQGKLREDMERTGKQLDMFGM